MGKKAKPNFVQEEENKTTDQKEQHAVAHTKSEKSMPRKLPTSKMRNAPSDQADTFNRQKQQRKQRLRIPVDPTALNRHSRGERLNLRGVKSKFQKIREMRKDINIEFAKEQAARAEILLDEDHGYLEADEGESTTDITQREIVEHVDITTATKYFKLALDFGPYRLRYTKNGTHLLLGGKRGHVAAFDWVQKKLLCEMNVMESVHDVTWLMNKTMYAVAQKNWVHVYDGKGVELHCIKKMHRSVRLEYLPYHFLLHSAAENGFLTWIDVSIGEIMGNYNSRMGKITVMTQNPWNAVTCIGGSKGVVSMWSPTVREPLAKMLCHPVQLTAIAADSTGIHLATAALDRKIKIWDIRQLEGPLETYHINTAASEIDISQRGLLALSMGNVCEIYRRSSEGSGENCMKPYLRQRTDGAVTNVRFCPYEDVLGVATEKGFTSLIVPGSGEPNFDTFEANPYQSRSQRREEEVHNLLEKVPAEFISLNPNQIDEVDVPSAKARLEAKVQLLTLKPPRIDFEPRNRHRLSKARRIKIKQQVKETRFREAAKEIRSAKAKLMAEEKKTESPDFIPLEPTGVLDRFKSKKGKK
uniref:BING4 C-terminal domain-containing protein n=1 Tax=Anopheles atroparvus TaxID=41427 RepID=A0A182J0A6_ANOAO